MFNIRKKNNLRLDKLTKNGYILTIMQNHSIQLSGKYYFAHHDLPLALKKVQKHLHTHAYDYTGIKHWHDFCELVIITGGQGVQVINGKRYKVRCGDVFVLQDRTEHAFEDYENLQITNIMFDSKLLEPWLDFLKRLPGYQVVFCIEPKMRSGREFRNMLHLPMRKLDAVNTLLNRLDRELSDCNPGYEAAAVVLLGEITVLLARSWNEKNDDSCHLVRLGELLSLLERDFRKTWTLQEMARYCSVSVNTLLRNFQTAVNTSPLQYLLKLRLEYACKLLLNSPRSIGEIADLAGFRDSNYFAKKFHAEYQLSPSEFRKKIR